MKVTEIWRNDGCYSNMYIELNDKYRVKIRLFNECEVSIQINSVNSVEDRIIQIFNTSRIEIDSSSISLINKEFNLPDDKEQLNIILSDVCRIPNYGDFSGTYADALKKIKSFYKRDDYAMKKYDVEAVFEKYGKDIETFVNNAFMLAIEVVVSMMMENKGEQK